MRAPPEPNPNPKPNPSPNPKPNPTPNPTPSPKQVYSGAEEDEEGTDAEGEGEITSGRQQGGGMADEAEVGPA